MARRKSPKAQSSTRKSRQKLVLMGDVRQAPVEIQEGGRTYNPLVALWVHAEDGYVMGQWIDEPGNPAATLVRALREPVPIPGMAQAPLMPSQVVLFDENLARQVQPLLAPLNVEIMISPPFEPFDELFNALFADLAHEYETSSTLDLPDDVLKPLVAAAERLWRAKPWEYVHDDPPFAVVPDRENARPLYAAVLGANEEVFGLALYTSLADYEATAEVSEPTQELGFLALPPADPDDIATRALEALHHSAFLVWFEPKNDFAPPYRQQMARAGWSRHHGALPTFSAMRPGEELVRLEEADVPDITLAVDAMVVFCQRYRQRLINEHLPIRDTVEVKQAGQTARAVVSVPAEDPSAPPATVFRFKVSLTYQKDIWRKIEVRSDQTLEALHYAIQDAFGWDDDHLYAFFMSGKAWDRSTEYVRPEARGFGERGANVRLDRLELLPRKRFLYIFDFGDEWRHDIRVEKADLPPDGDYPRIIEEHGEAPPQYPGMDEDDELVEEWDE
ncbi:MAG: plasmid pRiA4b ORF-3 family protein [Chloroflexota bacterium]